MVSISNIHNNITPWYHSSGRKDLPWRNTDDPYAIYVSEIMLQQTQVKTVLERFYHPFLERFPTLTDLANAEKEEVLNLWQGLGYYNRALNLWETAKRSNGTLPTTIEELEQLPGIGKNTAHAIASFAYHQPVPIMEANVKRIIHRFFALKSAKPQELWDKAEHLLNKNDSFTHNQAMMDIGSAVCTVKSPTCLVCPLAPGCKGKDSPTTYPEPVVKKKTPIRKRIIIAFANHQSEYFLNPRTTRFLNGLYGFHEYTHDEPILFMDQEITLAHAKKLGNITQIYSHFKLEGDVYHFELNQQVKTNYASYKLKDIKKLPLSRADEKVVRLLETRTS